jgi:hypothetical protein
VKRKMETKEGKLEIKPNGEFNNVVLKNKYKRNGLKLTLDKDNKNLFIFGVSASTYYNISIYNIETNDKTIINSSAETSPAE